MQIERHYSSCRQCWKHLPVCSVWCDLYSRDDGHKKLLKLKLFIWYIMMIH